LGVSYGFPYLFLTPEYLGSVGFWSFTIVGVTSGLFVMAYHISSYIYYSYRFPFLATLSRPLYKFCLNNSILPLVFYGFYIFQITQTLEAEGYGILQILINLSGLIIGSVLTISFSFTYFFGTIKGLETPDKDGKERNPLKPLKVLIKKDKELSESGNKHGKNKVSHYLKSPISIKLTRDSSHYGKQKLKEAIQEHHFSASIYFVILILLVVALNFKSFSIPAGASVFIIFSLYLMVTGAIYTRLKTWTLTVGIAVILILNHFSGFDKFKHSNYAFGMDYQAEKAEYSYENLIALSADSILSLDRRLALQSLENWRAKFPVDSPPHLIILNVSGGGLRSSFWTVKVLQELDKSVFGGNLLNNTHIITGSSGGMLGAAYYRELDYLERIGRLKIEKENSKYLSNIGQDALNPVAFTLAVHDLFLALGTIEYKGKEYGKDRGYSFDQKFNENTEGILDHSFADYRNLEFQSKMPTLLLAPTIIGDGRRLIMSTQGMSFLGVHPSYLSFENDKNFDAVEYSRLFKNQNADSLSFLTALRLSASFPYITPLVNLPSEPEIELIDAGVRDNEGLELSLRYLHQFKSWIRDNTKGVIVLQIKANRPDELAIVGDSQTRLDQISQPIKGVFQSFNNLQIYNKALLSEWSNEILDFPVEVLRFSLAVKKDNVSLSWHLTENEKRNINFAFDHLNNQTELEKLEYLLSLP
tara:strand:+ start:33334 stop:35436 length:2103 start_codon:yes stop_codon:yes gene_type:complete